jgi:MGT family glycosyltransferase
MSKIVFIEMPAAGHVNPTLPLIQELVQRGEHVTYYATEEFRPQIEQTGAVFQPYPARVLASTDIATATQSKDLTRVVSLIMRSTESLLPFLLSELPRQQFDAVVLDSNALWGHMAAKMLKLPRVSLMTTLMIGSAQFRQLTLREWVHMLLPMLPNIPSVVSHRSRLIRRFGASAFPKRPAFPARGDLNVAFIPRELQPDNPLVDKTFRFVGPSINPEARRGDVSFEALGPEPVVYISLGTLHLGSTDFFQHCFEAFRDMPAQFILSVGKQTDIQALYPIPANFIVRPSVPQLDVLQRAAVFITHGGMNSVLEGLYYGVPLILIPQQAEQLMIGLYVAAQGAGLLLREHVAGQRITAGELRHSLERIMAEPRYREGAGTLQQSLRACGGYRQAADEIQAFIAQGAYEQAQK